MTIRNGYAPGPDDPKPNVVRAGDGRIIYLTEATGPINPDGSHAVLPDPDPEPEPEVKPQVEPKRQPRSAAK